MDYTNFRGRRRYKGQSIIQKVLANDAEARTSQNPRRRSQRTFIGAEKVEKAVNIDKDLSCSDQRCGAIRLQCHVQVKVSARVKQITLGKLFQGQASRQMRYARRTSCPGCRKFPIGGRINNSALPIDQSGRRERKPGRESLIAQLAGRGSWGDEKRKRR